MFNRQNILNAKFSEETNNTNSGAERQSISKQQDRKSLGQINEVVNKIELSEGGDDEGFEVNNIVEEKPEVQPSQMEATTKRVHF